MKRRSKSSQPSVLTPDQARMAMAKAMLEAELQNNVRLCALANGWLFYHTHRSDRSDSGFPDCVMVRATEYSVEWVYAELKREGKNPTDVQQKWLDTFAITQNLLYTCAGNSVRLDGYTWRPMDWLDGTIQKRLSR